MTSSKSTVAHKASKLLFFKQIFSIFGSREEYPLARTPLAVAMLVTKFGPFTLLYVPLPLL